MVISGSGYEIEIWKDETREEYLFDEITRLTKSSGLETTAIAVRLTTAVTTRTVLIRAFGFSSGRAHSGVLLDNLLLVAVGNRVCGLEVPSLAVKWHVEVDLSSVFGVHAVPGSGTDIIVHGELDLLRMTQSGEILWRSGGKDILTGDLQIVGDNIEISDFEEDKYRFRLTDGKSELLRR
jgi:hypothetical protein